MVEFYVSKLRETPEIKYSLEWMKIKNKTLQT